MSGAFPRPLAVAVSGIALLAALYSCYWAARIGYADYLARDHSPEPTAAAIRLIPANAAYYAQLAESDPAHSAAPIRQALALDPSHSNLYLQFADIAEQRHDPALARAYLLRAVSLDRTFAPRWLLAEFYFRTRDQAHFWPAIHEALATSYDDISPLFDLCWQMTDDPATILPRALPEHDPPDNDVTNQYLDYLLAKNQVPLAAPVAARLLLHPTPQSLPSLLNYSNRFLAAALPSQTPVTPALRVWNTLAQSKLIPYPALQPGKGISITNSDFSHPFLGQAFDWRILKPPQIYLNQQDSLRFEFSGNQPEQCDLLRQYVPLQPSRAYKLTIRYFTQRLTGDTGLQWQLANLLPTSALPSSSSPRAQQYTFTTSPQTDLAALELTYRRTLGTVRGEGVFYLQSVNLEFAP